MKKDKSTITIVVVDDDEDDRQWVYKALSGSRLANNVRFIRDGEELMDFLYHRGQYAGIATLSYPGLILLDLNMPKKDGREVLKEIKSDPRLRHIPVIVLTTSKAEEDIFRAYNLGANSVIIKPVTYDGLIQIMRTLTLYWFEIAELPF